ncbi:glycosyltransferase family 4 protein [Methylobacterium sp. ID0610]|uniref:glycosyltransferase family 4 protein n=1 Tax=Methylobacterium carpenticola TaxID=3344827 RepID=UPI003697BAF6
MRVLIGTHYFESRRGGIEIVAGQLARQFRQRGIAVTWLASDADPSPPAACGEAVPLPASTILERRSGLPMPLPLPAAFGRIWRAVGRADVVQLHDSLYPTNVAILIAARLRAKPVVVVQHIGAVPYRSRLLRLLMAVANRCVARPVLASADRVVFISRTSAAHFASLRLRRAPGFITNGVDAGIFRPRPRDLPRAALRRALGLPPERPIALFVGRFVEKKGLAVLERLARARPEITFAFAGRGPLDPAAWTLPNVHVRRDLAGADLARLYQASDIFVLPSCGEGLPLVVQEALACGLPVLCGAESAAADEGLSRLVTGLPVTVDDPGRTAAAFEAALVACIARADDPAAAEARAAACATLYDWARAAAAHASVLDDLVAYAGRAALPETPPDRAG